jgi:hypothetical protein
MPRWVYNRERRGIHYSPPTKWVRKSHDWNLHSGYSSSSNTIKWVRGFPRAAFKETCKKHDKKPGRKTLDKPKDPACLIWKHARSLGLSVCLHSFHKRGLFRFPTRYLITFLRSFLIHKSKPEWKLSHYLPLDSTYRIAGYFQGAYILRISRKEPSSWTLKPRILINWKWVWFSSCTVALFCRSSCCFEVQEGFYLGI